MELRVNRDNQQGFSLIEFLVAIVILMVGMLGLLMAVDATHVHNLNNQFRNEAILVGDQEIVLEKSKVFDLISTNTAPHEKLVRREFRNAFKNYSVSRQGTSVGDLKEINVTVSWRHKGVRYTHNVFGMISPSEN